MAEQTTIDRVIKIISEQLDLSPDQVLTEATSVVDDLGADSLEVIEIVMQMESEFGIAIPEGEVSELQTIGDIADAIEQKLA